MHFLFIDSSILQQRQFQRMNKIIDSLETVLIDAHKVKGWRWVHEEPLWMTWSLENFGEPFGFLANLL